MPLRRYSCSLKAAVAFNTLEVDAGCNSSSVQAPKLAYKLSDQIQGQVLTLEDGTDKLS
jgi:hypothetical protein